MWIHTEHQTPNIDNMINTAMTSKCCFSITNPFEGEIKWNEMDDRDLIWINILRKLCAEKLNHLKTFNVKKEWSKWNDANECSRHCKVKQLRFAFHIRSNAEWSIYHSTFLTFFMLSSTKYQASNSYKFIVEMALNASESSFKLNKILAFNIFPKHLRFHIHKEMPLTMLEQYMYYKSDKWSISFSLGLIIRFTLLPKRLKCPFLMVIR